MSARWWNVNEEGEAYDSHPTQAAALLVQAEYPGDVVVQAGTAEEAERLAFPEQARPQCFGGHPAEPEAYLVSNPAIPLLTPVVACADHVGDLLGNLAKAALRNGASSVRPEVIRID